jgi:hypothetical protein
MTETISGSFRQGACIRHLYPAGYTLVSGRQVRRMDYMTGMDSSTP